MPARPAGRLRIGAAMKFDDCYAIHYCEQCGSIAEAHEIISRGSGGPREPWNTIYLCRVHHRLYHDLGRYTFALRFPMFYERIEAACRRAGRVLNKEGA
jgi:hypothetical protein